MFGFKASLQEIFSFGWIALKLLSLQSDFFWQAFLVEAILGAYCLKLVDFCIFGSFFWSFVCESCKFLLQDICLFWNVFSFFYVEFVSFEF